MLKKYSRTIFGVIGFFSLFLIALVPPPARAETVKIRLAAIEKEVKVMDDQSYAAWTFDGTIPGPVLRVKEGDTVEFTLENRGTMPHSIDFHAAQTAPNRNYVVVAPGKSLTYTWKAQYPGVFYYHCGAPPMVQHIANGMYGALIVEPKNPLPKAREYVLVQGELYASSTDVAAMMAKAPKNLMFNGAVNKHVAEPLQARPGELARIHVVNAGPGLFSAFHVIGGIFDKVYESGNPANVLRGVQTWTIPPGGGATFDITFPEAGTYPFVTHSIPDALHGGLGLIRVSEEVKP